VVYDLGPMLAVEHMELEDGEDEHEGVGQKSNKEALGGKLLEPQVLESQWEQISRVDIIDDVGQVVELVHVPAGQRSSSEEHQNGPDSLHADPIL